MNQLPPTAATPSIPQLSQNYSVSIWEGIAITAGAVALVMVALMGLGMKAVRYAFDPRRAEAIAQSMISYQIPPSSTGIFGVNIGGLKVAMVISSNPDQADTEPAATALLIVKAPVDDPGSEEHPWKLTDYALSFSEDYPSESQFQVDTAQTTSLSFCGQSVQVLQQFGTLTLVNSNREVAAVRYEAATIFNNSQRLVVLMTTGPQAEKNAAAVFQSLQCKI
ncbi:hypothetical protein DO97_19995 [Neosynechococcus sphagnicola sy1]|uniref:Uncharacterized protein n=1 Tax=Neosynechococcus sphagnicola sy1 TaxID=1497020 RepID=A0A098TM44_9CYAN|nr:hypothetical protein [Neosynechococcus sphagnicola]KGF73379.1 hypothetical protein DO97_19995 [Neosynechococcus sphagnicola sy1]